MNQVRAFGNASGVFAENAREAFELVDRSTVERKLYDLAAAPGEGVKEDVFVGFFEQGEALQVRLQVLSQLGSYSKALEGLASADFQKEINSASSELYGALTDLSSTYQKATGSELGISKEQLGLLATAVASIGGAAADNERRKAILTIIIATDPAVQKAAALIEKELGKDSELASFTAANLASMQGSLQQAYNQQKSSPGSSFQARLELLQQIRELNRTARGIPRFFEDVSVGARKLASAHAVLRKASEGDKLDTAEVAAAIGDLVARAKAAKRFRDSLEKDK